MFTTATTSFQYGEHVVTIETGKIARQATAAVMVKMEDTVVLVTVVGKKEARPGQDFFPLTVDYQERTYAAGRIPGGYFKREGRPTEKEILTCRLIDRPVRPLFPEGFKNEVQIVAMVLSVNPDIDPDIPAMLGASAALSLSGIPFDGPIGAARVGYIDGEYVLNPGFAALENSDLDLVVAGTEKAVLMVESEAQQLSEETMLGAVYYGHEQMQTAITAINELVEEAGLPIWDWEPSAVDSDLIAKVKQAGEAGISDAYNIQEKLTRRDKIVEVQASVVEQLVTDADDSPSADDVKNILHDIEKDLVRERVLSGQLRIDGRDTRTVRPIEVELGVLPRTHGSALFTRGETQAIVVATLGNDKDAQLIEQLHGEARVGFMLHYNFPPFCVGEAGRMMGPKRREIGHGRLAKRAISPILPEAEDCPYTLRVVSEITESNGSSSMATVCGTSLALMDAGVSTKAPVAGIAMGLIKDETRFAVLTDILGDEDHLGDMDFKVAGTSNGITALQMDIKTDGINKEIMQQALSQAKDGRVHILGIMNEALSTPRTEVSSFAPRIFTMQIDKEKIRDVIGKGGVVIRGLIEDTGANIDINDDGEIKIATSSDEVAQDVISRIEMIVAEPEPGVIYEGKVTRIMDFGALVAILNGKQGMVHISQLSNERVANVSDVLSEGQDVKVKVLEVEGNGRIRLSIKEVGGGNAGSSDKQSADKESADS